MQGSFNYGGDGGIRTHVPLRTTAFRVRLVMTASIRLHIDHALRDQVRKAFFVRKKYNKSTKPIYHKS